MGRREEDDPWTQAELELACKHFLNGETPAEIACRREFLGRRNKDAIRMRLHRAGYTARGLRKTEWPDAPTPPKHGAFLDVLDCPPRPFEVPFPLMASSRDGKPLTAVVYGDTHYPFHDDRALKIVKAIIKDVKPDIIVNVGDLVDAWQISSFDKDPSRTDSLQDNIDAARQHLHELSQLAPKAVKVYLEGNHENRLTRAIWKMDGAAREFAKLRNFQSAMAWPALMDTEAMGWKFIGGREQSRTPVLPKIITKHGTVVRKFSGMTAKGEWEKYGASGISGHTHRLGHFFHRDHNGTARWIETGCTCLLDPPYGVDFDWQQGLVIMGWSADRKLMDEHLVSIRDGATLFHHKEYVT